VTIGVNDIQRHFIPDHLLIMDKHEVFKGARDRQAIMEFPQFRDTLWYRAKTSLWSTWQYKTLNVRRYQIRRYRSPEETAKALRSPDVLMALPHYVSTVYTSCSLAVALGATWVGVIGLDLVGHHLAKKLDYVNRVFAILTKAMDIIEVEFVNLSDQSLITSIPRGST